MLSFFETNPLSRSIIDYNDAMKSQNQFFNQDRSDPNLAKRVSRAAILGIAKRIVENFQPDKILLFGSYAYGKPHGFSDVDMLVVMPARNEIDKAVQILNVLDPPFSLDLIVRTPHNLQWRLKEGDWFLREVVSKGEVLHEKVDGEMGTQGRGRPRNGKPTRKRKTRVS